MTTYLRPGVFVEETLQSLADTSASTSDSIAAFVGTASKGGPLGPTLVTSWSQYRSLFGDIQHDTDDLAYGVFTFFNNGGSQAYVVRAVNSNATAAKLTLDDAGDLASETSTPKAVVDVTAKAPGAWASDATSGIFVTVDAAKVDGRFDLVVEVGQGGTLVAREQFVDLTLDPADPRNALTIVNSSTIGSNFVTLSLNTAQNGKVWGTDYANPAAKTATVLTGGTDGSGTPDLFAATQTLGTLDANLMLNLPGVSDSAVLTDVINWATTAGNVFVVVDGPAPAPNDTAATVATALTTMVSSLPSTSHAAIYGPYLYIADPASRVPGALRLTAPGGSVLGQFARNDVVRGVQKAPAGTGTALKGVINVAARFDPSTLDNLNQKQVNVIRSVPGAGFCIMGARTLATGMPDRYINIRRSLMFIERDLVNLTKFAVFEVNDSDTWDSIRAVIDQYLNTQFQVGLLSGSTPAQAYYVTCDSTNNDATSVNAGVVNVEVGVALNSPAEFIIIRIGQFDGGSSVTDTAA